MLSVCHTYDLLIALISSNCLIVAKTSLLASFRSTSYSPLTSEPSSASERFPSTCSQMNAAVSFRRIASSASTTSILTGTSKASSPMHLYTKSGFLTKTFFSSSMSSSLFL
ncbi:hypothetical protein THIOM_001316 [Candidatus Thiomargarita nelsonii]|uniref:Uncharacterized protein n=1 Tax=Candidatus Thiomargarita nelsonii TaxID=1003181 RepID=A0A176S421_9GAMM|nr:hypothetical protein THIOM_001316 [Candidatus Thiomargarita nelsonii]